VLPLRDLLDTILARRDTAELARRSKIRNTGELREAISRRKGEIDTGRISALAELGADVNVVAHGMTLTDTRRWILTNSARIFLFCDGTSGSIFCGRYGVRGPTVGEGRRPESSWQVQARLFDVEALVTIIAGGKHMTAIHAASREGSTDMVNLLLEHGADPHVEGANCTVSLRPLCIFSQGYVLDDAAESIDFGQDGYCRAASCTQSESKHQK
jgi:hypothetical protein